MIGQSGVGKSTVMENAFIELMQQGRGGSIIDPHGLSADKILRYVPRERLNDVILIDLRASAVPGFIPQFSNIYEEELFKMGVLSALRSLHKDRWGDETERIIQGALDATTEYYGFINLPAVYLFIARDSFRTFILKKCKNPLLQDFTEQYDDKLRPSEQMSKFSPPLNKVDEFVRPMMRILTSQDKAINWKRVMNDRRIVIVRIPKGEIGEENAKLVGALVVLNIKIAALSRKPEDPPFHLFIDECQNFLGSVDFETFSSELRKYNVKLFLATQYLDHFPSLSALFGNFPNGILYRVSGKDAEIIEKNYLVEGLAQELVNMPNYQFLAHYVHDTLPNMSHAIKARAKIKKKGNEPPMGAVINESLRRWASDREKTDKKLLKFLAYPA